MAVGVPLSQLLDDLKAETNTSLNPAHGLNSVDSWKYILRRTQEELYTSHDWPRLLVERDVSLLTGVRYYDYPDDLDFNFINTVHVRYGTVWTPLAYRITPEDLNLYNSEDGFRTFPPLKWQHYADADTDEQFEVWPVPSENGTLRLTGRKALKPLVLNTDKTTLDGTLIVLFAAAEILGRLKSEDAQLKLSKANDYLRMVRSRQNSGKTAPFAIGSGEPTRRGRAGIDYIPPGYGKG